MSCAGNRKASLRSSSSGRQPPKAKGKGQVISRKPGSHSSIADATTFSSLLTKQRRGMSRAAAHLSHLFREPAAWICFLLFCPTTCLLLEKQPRAAKNLQSSKSQNNDQPIQCFHPRNCWFLYKKTLWGESQESRKGMWLFFATLWKERKIYF